MESRDSDGSIPRGTTLRLSDADVQPQAAAVNWSAPEVVAHAFSLASGASRARVLGSLLGSVGTLALAVIGGGAFIKFFLPASAVSVEDAARVTSGQILELASYVQQSNPAAIDQVLALLSQDISTMSALGASIAALAINFLSRR